MSKRTYRIDVFHSYNRFGNGEHPDVKNYAIANHMEFDGGGMVLGTDRYGAIYYGTKENLLNFAHLLSVAGFELDYEGF